MADTLETPAPEKTGEIVYDGHNSLSGSGGNNWIAWFRCVDCGTTFPGIGDDDRPKCNGHTIDKCPWCRPGSKPWTKGRGL